MTQDEAIKKIKSEYPNCDIGKVTETYDYFVINILPKKNKVSESEDETIGIPLCDNSLKAVNKATGSIFTYNPIKHG